VGSAIPWIIELTADVADGRGADETTTGTLLSTGRFPTALDTVLRPELSAGFTSTAEREGDGYVGLAGNTECSMIDCAAGVGCARFVDFACPSTS
jgi:hypothetical protein|tara:strand:- start:607 stop:891 length:285 start_codon:yes stop_codon:yes gene_type:complete